MNANASPMNANASPMNANRSPTSANRSPTSTTRLPIRRTALSQPRKETYGSNRRGTALVGRADARYRHLSLGALVRETLSSVGRAEDDELRWLRAHARAERARQRATFSRGARQEWLEAARCHDEAVDYFQDGAFLAGLHPSSAQIQAAVLPTSANRALVEASERIIVE